MSPDELSVYFENPATDPLGYEHVSGRLRCGRDAVELQFDEADRAFRKTPAQAVSFTYEEVDGVEYTGGWFQPKILTFRVKTPEKLAGFPGADVGRVELRVIRKSRGDASKAAAFVEYKQSEAYLIESAERLEEKRNELESGL